MVAWSSESLEFSLLLDDCWSKLELRTSFENDFWDWFLESALSLILDVLSLLELFDYNKLNPPLPLPFFDEAESRLFFFWSGGWLCSCLLLSANFNFEFFCCYYRECDASSWRLLVSTPSITSSYASTFGSLLSVAEFFYDASLPLFYFNCFWSSSLCCYCNCSNFVFNSFWASTWVIGDANDCLMKDSWDITDRPETTEVLCCCNCLLGERSGFLLVLVSVYVLLMIFGLLRVFRWFEKVFIRSLMFLLCWMSCLSTMSLYFSLLLFNLGTFDDEIISGGWT